MEDPSVVGAFVVISMGMFKLIEKLVSKSANGGNGVDSYRGFKNQRRSDPLGLPVFPRGNQGAVGSG